MKGSPINVNLNDDQFFFPLSFANNDIRTNTNHRNIIDKYFNCNERNMNRIDSEEIDFFSFLGKFSDACCVVNAIPFKLVDS